MHFFKELLSPRSKSKHQSQVDRIFAKANIRGTGKINDKYQQIFMQQLQSSIDQQKFMKMIIMEMGELNIAESIIKLMVMIHGTLIQSGYKKVILEGLENLEYVVNRHYQQEMEHGQWFVPFYRAYATYLARLPMIGQIMVLTLMTQTRIPINFQLTHLFLLMNHLTPLLRTLNLTFNTIGRYYSSNLNIYRDLFQVLRRQLSNIYYYIKYLIDDIFIRYQYHSNVEIQCFIQSIPDIQIMADQMEEFLMNKYFNGKQPLQQVYLKEEEVLKLKYHLERQKKKG